MKTVVTPSSPFKLKEQIDYENIPTGLNVEPTEIKNDNDEGFIFYNDFSQCNEDYDDGNICKNETENDEVNINNLLQENEELEKLLPKQSSEIQKIDNLVDYQKQLINEIEQNEIEQNEIESISGNKRTLNFDTKGGKKTKKTKKTKCKKTTKKTTKNNKKKQKKTKKNKKQKIVSI